MERRLWHDVVIWLTIAVLAAAGTAAIWGQDIRGWFEEEGGAETGPEPPPGGTAL